MFVQFEELIISNLSNKIINSTNVISIFVKSHKKLPKVEELCLNFTIYNFTQVVYSNEFRELDLNLMRILLKSVVPMLPIIKVNNGTDNEEIRDNSRWQEEEEDEEEFYFDLIS